MVPITMPEKKDHGADMAPSNKCMCCPYGFHIDRDFVRFCDSLYNNAQLDKLRQHKRERRKEKRTVESYLGLGTARSPPEPQRKYPETPRYSATLPRDLNSSSSEVVSKSAATLPHNADLNGDGLQNAMQDFEETWQNSLRKSCSSSDIGKHNGFKPLHVSPISAKREDRTDTFSDSNVNKSRRSSTSSESSQSTAISSASVPVTLDSPFRFSMVQQNHYFTNSLPKPCLHSVHSGSGIDKNVLNTIREQMAASLKRMRELEDQVKTIPVLQVKIYSLSEEKKSLLNQLQSRKPSLDFESTTEGQKCLEKQLKKLENEGVMSPTLSRKCLSKKLNEEDLSSPSIASSLDATITKKEYIQKEIISHLETNDPKNNKSMKNASTSCSVLTRDIGIGYVPSKYKSIGVGSDISFKDLISSNYKTKKGFDNFTSVSSESLESDSESPGVSDDTSRSFIHKRYHSNVSSIKYTSSVMPKVLIAASTNTDAKHFCNKSVNTSLPVTSPSEKTMKHKSVAVFPILNTKCVQAVDNRTFRNTTSQTMPEPVSSVLKRDVGVAVEIPCRSCSTPKKSLGVGDCTVALLGCDQCDSLENSASLPKSNCETCVLRQTETVGVGDYDIREAECEKCLQNSFDSSKQVLSVGVNTSFENASPTKSDMQICDKCSATIQSVAHGFATSTPLDSKIPRPSLKTPVSSTKSSFTKLPKLKPQDLKLLRSEEAFVKDGHAYLKEKVQKIMISHKSIDAETIQTTTVNTQKLLKYNDEKSPDIEMLPDFTNLPAVPHKKKELSKEVKSACKVLNDNLQKPDRGGEKKTLSSLTIIQNEWFKVANQKKADPHLIEDYLDAFEDFSKPLLAKIVNLSDNNGNTALHYAISYGNFDVVSILIDSKVCDVNKKNKAGYTSIMLVALANMKNDTHHYVVQRLFSIGDINIKATQNGQTALMLAVSHGKKDIVKTLLEAGAEVNLQDKDGSTALMCAAEHGQIDIAKILLSHPDCDPSIVDSDGCNALAIAMEAGYKDIGLLIYTNMNFSRGSSPYSTLKTRKRSTPRSTPPPRTPTRRTPPLPSPSARSTNSIPSSFHFPS